MLAAITIEVPSWTEEVLQSLGDQHGLTVAEVAKAIVCMNSRHFSFSNEPNFTVPLAMEGDFAPDDYMVIGRGESYVTLSPTECLSFDEAATQFQANGMTKADILEVVKSS